ncbi:MAG: BamA/TamA family outer membrane protein [Acidobacteriota bacterium]
MAACLMAVLAPALAVAQSYDPALRFRTINTTHFAIHFHESERSDAEYLKEVAEHVWQTLNDTLRLRPPLHTDVILVDQTEDANGWATPTPRPTVMVTAAWPSGVEFIGSTNDWISLVFTHEFTHIVHLDQFGSWATAVRRIFGRVPLAFPNTLLPTWQIEGLATLEESTITGTGREYAGNFRAITNEAARLGRLEPIDRVNGGLTAWPAGNAVYAYGLGFTEYLAGRFGAERIGQLMTATSAELPYLWPRAFTRVFGVSVGTLWHDYQASLAVAAALPDARARANAAEKDDAVRLTHHGFVVSAPRVAPAVCDRCAAQIVYTVQTPHEFPGLYAVPVDGSGPPARLASRYLGNTTGVGQATLYFDQQEQRRNAGLYADLYAFDRRRQTVRRLSRDLRLGDPDASPDGRSLVAVRSSAGRRDLVLVALHGAGIVERDLTVIDDARDGQFTAPRFSPDGTRVAAERQRRGHLSEIVVIDLATRLTRVVASAPDTRYVTPAWRADGQAIVAAEAKGDDVFNVVEVDLSDGTSRALTHTTGGATWPEVTPDGQSLIFVGYTTGGFDLFRMPYRALDPKRTAVEPERAGTPPNPMSRPNAELTLAPVYSPWRMLTPTFWTPTVESSSDGWRIGALVTGTDVLNYHAYAASVAWLTSQPVGTTRVLAPDVSLSYAYTRWTMQPWVSVSRTTSFFGAVPDESGVPITATVRERQFETGVFVPTLGVRRSRALSLSFIQNVAEIDIAGATDTLNRSAIRASVAASTAHSYGYSISPEDGMLAGATMEVVRRGLGADANGVVWTGDARAYLPGASRHHVVALRASAGGTSGELDSSRVFLLGGATTAPGPASFDSGAFSLLRGFSPNTFAGSHIILFNADYRLPLWRPERGINTWPIFLRTLHASVFADAGQVWTRSRAASDWKIDAGAELSADAVLGYGLPWTLATGAAFGHDRSGRVEDAWRVYVRLGRAF